MYVYNGDLTEIEIERQMEQKSSEKAKVQKSDRKNHGRKKYRLTCIHKVVKHYLQAVRLMPNDIQPPRRLNDTRRSTLVAQIQETRTQVRHIRHHNLKRTHEKIHTCISSSK